MHPSMEIRAWVSLGSEQRALSTSRQEVLIRPDAQVAYVSCDSSHKVAAISLSDWKVQKLIDAGRGADGLAWASAR